MRRITVTANGRTATVGGGEKAGYGSEHAITVTRHLAKELEAQL